MERNLQTRIVSSSVKISRCSFSPSLHGNVDCILPKDSRFCLERDFGPLQFPFDYQSISFDLHKARDAVHRFVSSDRFSGGIFSSVVLPFLWSPFTLGQAMAETEPPGNYARRHGKEDEERILISEVLIRNKDGEELEREDLAAEAAAALKSCRPNSALTLSEVQDDVHRIIESGYFFSCMPVAIDTRDGIRLVFQVEPNQEFRGLVCEGASVLPSKFLEDAFRDGYGKVVNVRHLNDVVNSVNGWYAENGLFGLVSDVEILSGGIVRVKISEALVNDITLRFLDRKTGEPTTGKTKPETILRQLTTKKGQVYSLLEGKRDAETILTMGIMEDCSIIPQPAGDTGKVDVIMNLVERPNGGLSAGGGISSGITGGPLSGLIGSIAYSHRNLFGRNQKVNFSLEKGQVDSIIRMNYTDPWIEGDDKRTSRSIMIQTSTTPGTLVHGNCQPNNANVTIGRATAGIEFGRPLRPKWSGTLGILFQRAGARDDRGSPMIKDFYSSPLTASGNNYDDMLIAKAETVYSGSGNHNSPMFVFSVEQALPALPDWLCFNRIIARGRKGAEIGPPAFSLACLGGTWQELLASRGICHRGTNSVRGYEEGAVGSGRSYVVASSEISFSMVGPVEGVAFADYGTDLGRDRRYPVIRRGEGKPGSGFGYGAGIRIESPLGPLRLEYALNGRRAARFHFGVGHRS